MKINIPSIIVTVIVNVLVVGVFAYANWTPPALSPPNCDPLVEEGCNTPVNIGRTTQIKTGALGVEGLFQVGTQGEISLSPGPGTGPIGINVGLSGGAKRFISFIPWSTVKTEFGMENVTGFINTIETSGGAAPNLEIRRNGTPVATFRAGGVNVAGDLSVSGQWPTLVPGQSSGRVHDLTCSAWAAHDLCVLSHFEVFGVDDDTGAGYVETRVVGGQREWRTCAYADNDGNSRARALSYCMEF